MQLKKKGQDYLASVFLHLLSKLLLPLLQHPLTITEIEKYQSAVGSLLSIRNKMSLVYKRLPTHQHS
jgi:hypothetical protein